MASGEAFTTTSIGLSLAINMGQMLDTETGSPAEMFYPAIGYELVSP